MTEIQGFVKNVKMVLMDLNVISLAQLIAKTIYVTNQMVSVSVNV